MKHPAGQPGEHSWFHFTGVLVAALNHRQWCLADRQHIAGLQERGCIPPQHLNRIIEGAEQVGLHGQNSATVSALPLSLISTQRSWTAHRHRHPLTAGQTSERAVIHPLHINPERVDQLQRCATTDLNRHPSSCGLQALDDVCGPIAISTGLLIGMIGLDSCGDGETGKISPAQQRGVHPQLRHENLHAWMGVADLQHTGDTQYISTGADFPIPGHQPQGGGGPQPMAGFQPGHPRSEGQGGDQQRHNGESAAPQRKPISEG